MKRAAGVLMALLTAALVLFCGLRFHLNWTPAWRTGEHAAETEDLSTLKESFRVLLPAAGRIAVRAADAVLMTGTGSRILDAGAVGRGTERSGAVFPSSGSQWIITSSKPAAFTARSRSAAGICSKPNGKS